MRAQLTRQARIALALHNRRGTARRKAFKLEPEHFTGSPDVIDAVIAHLRSPMGWQQGDAWLKDNGLKAR